jgi:tetratricopeptide (TPR) repeat protein
MRIHGLVADPQEWRAADTLSEARLWSERHATKLDERIGASKTAILTSGWPFRDQPPTAPPIAETDTLGQIVELLMRDRISWQRAHFEAAAWYARQGDTLETIREYQTLASVMPFDALPLLRLGEFLVQTGAIADAGNAFRESLQKEETGRGYAGLGGIALLSGAIPEAAAYYEKAVRLSATAEDRAESQYVLALLHLRSGNRERAAQELKEILEAVPTHRQAAELLSRIGEAR